MPNCEKRLRRHLSQCIIDHHLIVDGDHVLVGLSGGKDSWALLRLLALLRDCAPIHFDISAVMIDGGFVGLDQSRLLTLCRELDVPFYLEKRDLFAVAEQKRDPGSLFCSLCARLRRGVLYDCADRLSATKIALGHHLNDAIETLLLNMFFTGRLAALPAMLMSNAGHVPVIRPMLYCAEQDIVSYAEMKGYQPVKAVCPTMQDHVNFDPNVLLRRQQMKAWLNQMHQVMPHMFDSARKALLNPNLDRFWRRSVEVDSA